MELWLHPAWRKGLPWPWLWAPALCDPSTPEVSHRSRRLARKGAELSGMPATVNCKEVSLLKLSQHFSEAWRAESHTGQHSRTEQKSRRKRLPILGWRVRSVGTLLSSIHKVQCSGPNPQNYIKTGMGSQDGSADKGAYGQI